MKPLKFNCKVSGAKVEEAEGSVDGVGVVKPRAAVALLMVVDIDEVVWL